jgi:Lon protease-like protein
MGIKRLVCAVVTCGVLSATGTVRAQSALPPEIPIFPLEVTLLFPGVTRPLHIFESRYRAMVADALKGNRIIGMTVLMPGHEADYAGRPPISPIGCAGIITDVEELPGGRFNIVLRGLVKFRVTSEDASRPYRLARVEAMPEVLNDSERADLHLERQRLEALITKGSDSKVPPGTSDEDLVNMVAQYLPLDAAERQRLFELPNALVRARALIELIEKKMGIPRSVAD